MKNNNKLKILLIILVISLIIIIKITNLDSYVYPDMIRQTIQNYPTLAPIIFILVYIATAMVFLPATPLTIISGALFGTQLGMFYSIIAATIGASFAFFISRSLGKEYVDKILKTKYKNLEKYNEKAKENGFLATLLMRLIPGIPFNGTNFVLGLTKIKFKDYLFATILGIIPATFAFVFFGNSLAELNTTNIIISIILIIIIIISLIIYNYKRKN